MKGASTPQRIVRSVLFEMALEQKAQGRRIAELRERKRLTQPAAADRIGISLRAYQDWEAGKARPRWTNLERLAEVFGVSVEALIGNEPLPSTGETPDLMGQYNGGMPEWARSLHLKLDAILLHFEISAAFDELERRRVEAEDAAEGPQAA